MTPEELSKQIEKQGFEYYLNQMLGKVPDDIDKRQGSIIYDAIAPAAMLMAQQSLDMSTLVKAIYVKTATGEFLDYKAVEYGTERQKATATQARAKFLNSAGKPIASVDIGDRFASIGSDPIFYKVVKINADYTGILVAEEPGTQANGYLGQILPITPNDQLSWAEIVEVVVPARDDETDDHLRERLLASDNWIAYGGNIADYLDMLAKITSVGAAQVYPAWQGGGTVKLVILDNDYNAPSAELLAQVKNEIDPPDSPGLGYGLAPIDHTVTVVAPKEVHIDVSATVQVDVQADVETTKLKVTDQLESYFLAKRHGWASINKKSGRGYVLAIYRAQLLTEIMKVDGVVNCSLPMLNGKNEDVVLTFNAETSQLPVLGKVVVNVG